MNVSAESSIRAASPPPPIASHAAAITLVKNATNTMGKMKLASFDRYWQIIGMTLTNFSFCKDAGNIFYKKALPL
ncbi:MAG TPA: hypothetical protein DCG57_07650 [Candidatus Riflebacteria bacterium]|jgi:hypothetical protein|nr:hypothetical protein [Candidatus Riflebacteria bacterium]